MIRTKLLPKFSEVFYPILHFSLGPKSVGSRSTIIDEAYGYLWLLVQNPDTGALNLFLVNDVDGRPYNWYSRSDIPPTVSLSNPVSLYLPNSENITWATFAFTEEGEPLFAVQRDLPGRKKIEVYDRNGNVWLEITNAKSPFIVPEALVNRKVFGSNVYLFYVTSSDTEIRYQGVIDTSDFGVLTSVPVNARNDLFIVDYTYRKDGIELVYSTASRNYMYVHVEAEAYHLDEEASIVSSSFFERIQKAIRHISRMGVFPRLEKNFVKNVYLNSLTDNMSTEGYLGKGVIDKIYKKEIGDNGETYASSTVNSIQKIFVGDNYDPEEVNAAVKGLVELRTILLRLEPGDDAETSPSYNGDYYRTSFSSSDDLSNLVFSNGDYYRTSFSSSDDLFTFAPDLGMIHNEQFLSQNSDECIMDSSLYMRFRQTAS